MVGPVLPEVMHGHSAPPEASLQSTPLVCQATLPTMREFGRLEMSSRLGRQIRQDDIDLLGVSSQTLLERAARSGEFQHAIRLADYYWKEMQIIGEALYTWIDDIVGFEIHSRQQTLVWPLHSGLMEGVRGFAPGEGDLRRAHLAFSKEDAEAGIGAVEFMRVRWCAVHDFLVCWIQELLTSLANSFGEEAVLKSIRHSYEAIWRPRYAIWEELSALERLQLSVEGMRGHLSGAERRGDVGILDAGDRYEMILDPCGSCGVMRRGDPESGRSGWPVAGNTIPHPWTWGRVGVGWYAVHSPIVMEYLWYERGENPMRPLEGCDLHSPCRWFIYKDSGATRPEHRQSMGFGGSRWE